MINGNYIHGCYEKGGIISKENGKTYVYDDFCMHRYYDFFVLLGEQFGDSGIMFRLILKLKWIMYH